ncbi:acetyl-CoA acetyltransferase family protein [Agromyces flavus]|uniref:Probable acetyl-CoA acetyltransferase n=1 Tax=Agromyces flavus TaxID=589382 RepID=A0A1H1Z5X5_9MICO|nr:thiolase family protein [Agromyces flavus]MCP2366938.1 acetyl-CoA acetyltransferase family protein [Agromyces flavus]GGI46724.1 acetyl-CoA acyltransferase [Agromyces flavus]SDT29017.1 acetyl-CoA acyltransferase [Agromyces flavus]
MGASYVYDAVRTPFGRIGKSLAGVRPDDLAAATLTALADRNPGLDPGRVDEVFLGAANQAGEDNRNVARMATLLAGWPTSVPGATVNRLCGSSVESVIQASRAIETGDADLIVAGGVESMSRAPWVLPKPGRAYPAGNEVLHSTTLGWRLVNPRMPTQWTIALGESAEILADRYGISRDAQDEFAVRSHRNAAAAWDSGVYANEVVPVPGVALERDENIRPDASTASLAPLQPSFRPDGTVTAGNASPLTDGASALVIGAEDALDGAEPLARITGRGSFGNDPDIFGIAPVEAANRALARAGRTWADVDLVELNEAFASQSLACLALWPDLDPEKVNIHGGAIAIGHPLGASGGRIIGHAAHELARRGGGVAVAAICIGVGQGLAVVLER